MPGGIVKAHGWVKPCLLPDPIFKPSDRSFLVEIPRSWIGKQWGHRQSFPASFVEPTRHFRDDRKGKGRGPSSLSSLPDFLIAEGGMDVDLSPFQVHVPDPQSPGFPRPTAVGGKESNNGPVPFIGQRYQVVSVLPGKPGVDLLLLFNHGDLGDAEDHFPVISDPAQKLLQGVQVIFLGLRGIILQGCGKVKDVGPLQVPHVHVFEMGGDPVHHPLEIGRPGGGQLVLLFIPKARDEVTDQELLLLRADVLEMSKVPSSISVLMWARSL